MFCLNCIFVIDATAKHLISRSFLQCGVSTVTMAAPEVVRGGCRGVQSTGARHVLRGPSRGPALIKFFFRDTREEMLEKLCLRYVTVEPTSSVRSRGVEEGHVSPSKNSRPPSKKRKFVLGRGC